MRLKIIYKLPLWIIKRTVIVIDSNMHQGAVCTNVRTLDPSPVVHPTHRESDWWWRASQQELEGGMYKMVITQQNYTTPPLLFNLQKWWKLLVPCCKKKTLTLTRCFFTSSRAPITLHHIPTAYSLSPVRPSLRGFAVDFRLPTRKG